MRPLVLFRPEASMSRGFSIAFAHSTKMRPRAVAVVYSVEVGSRYARYSMWLTRPLSVSMRTLEATAWARRSTRPLLRAFARVFPALYLACFWLIGTQLSLLYPLSLHAA